MADHKTIAIYNEKAQDYAKMVSKGAPDASLLAFMEALPPGGRALDLGCGPGNASAIMRDAGFVPDAVDASPSMIALAKEKFGLEGRVATFDDLSGDAIYDGVWANFSLLHAPRAELPRHFEAIAKALRPGGIFHIGMKTGTDVKRDRLGRQYTYVTVPELHGLFEDAGFAVMAEKTGEEAGFDGVIAPWVVMLAKKTADA
ncbi:MAG: class I SAM-dependent methyltransferase [Pseudomonadota bacterium]